MSKKNLRVILAAGLLSACAQKATAPQPGNGAGTVSAGGTLGPVDARARAVIVSPIRGATSVDTSNSHIGVNVSCPHGGTCATDQGATAALLATKMLLSDGTNTIAVVPDPLPSASGSTPGKTDQPVILPQNEYTLGFHAAAALKVDTEYQLQIASDAAIVGGFLDSTPAENAAALAADKVASIQESRLFTGSLPYAVSTELSNDPKKPLASIRVGFSEPMQMSSLASNVQIADATGKTIGSCAWSALSRKCADSTTKEIGQTVDFVFTGTVTKADIIGAQLVLQGSLMGSGRTLSDGLRAVGKPLTAASYVSIAMPMALWASCSTSGDVMCIRDLGPW